MLQTMGSDNSEDGQRGEIKYLNFERFNQSNTGDVCSSSFTIKKTYYSKYHRLSKPQIKKKKKKTKCWIMRGRYGENFYLLFRTLKIL